MDGASQDDDRPRDRLTRAELARTAGVDEALVEQLVGGGILHPDAVGHEHGDVYRARFAALAVESGIALDDLARSIADGVVRVGDVDLLFPGPVAAPRRSHTELAEELGVDVELIGRIRLGCGLPSRTRDDLVRPDEAHIVRLMITLARGFGDEEVAVRIARNYGERVQRIVVSAVRTFQDLVSEPQVGAIPQISPETRRRLSERGRAMVELAEELITATHRRHMETATLAMWVRTTELQMARHGKVEIGPEVPPAIGFADLSEFTRLTDEEGDDLGMWLAGQLVTEAESAAAEHGSRIVKALGDGVMLHSADAGRLIDTVLTMLDTAPRAGLPPLHVGVHAGPLIELDGDYYGRTVNVASRIAAHASAGEVLVSSEAVARAAPGLVLEERPGVALRGLSEPMTLFRVSR
jgi:adenylate cyclase